MDNRAAKLALARKKLKDHQDKKHVTAHKIEANYTTEHYPKSSIFHDESEISVIEYKDNVAINEDNDEIKIYSPGVCESNQKSQNEPHNVDINVTEILISNKRNMELQITELQSKLAEIDSNYRIEIMAHNDSKNELKNLKSEFMNINEKYNHSLEQVQHLMKKNEELNALMSSLVDGNNNISEQLEFTKTVLTAKETENASLYSQLNQLQNELDVSKLQIQQLINGSNSYTTNSGDNPGPSQSELLQKVENLEQQLKLVHKERNQINSHYEHYVCELNEQVKSLTKCNEDLLKKVHSLSNRESSLVEQISEMEIRIQNLQVRKMEVAAKSVDKTNDVDDLQNKYQNIKDQLEDLTLKYEHVKKLHIESEKKVKELQEATENKCNHDNISISKLTADIASDKVAAQRATEQNKKLKSSMQELEEAFIKMTQDKLELTEKVTAEKFLNRELTIKLADSEEKCKDYHIKIRAKDDEMIRLQASYRNLESKFAKLSNAANLDNDLVGVQNSENQKTIEELAILGEHECAEIDEPHNHNHDYDCPKSIFNTNMTNSNNILKEDAMVKLQERFLKIMDEVADLSDEKHRLEHIILQLQNETETICEYVALYQQQRSLLKKRDEERSTQIKVFQFECDRLKRQLEELSQILLKFAEDRQLSSYFQVESRQKDMNKVRSLLLNLKSNTLVDPERTNLKLNNIYPCNCCSGNLIDV